MSLTLPVIVYDNGDMFNELFNAIAATLGANDYRYLIQMAVLLTGTWAIMSFSAQRNMTVLLRWLGMYYIAFYVMFIPKITVEIIDRINQNQFYSVANIPLGLGVVASLTSVIGDGLTQLVEETFSLPNDMLYETTGMVMGSRLVLASAQFQVTDPDFAQSLQSFVHQCVYYDILLGKYSWSDLVNSNNIWQFVTQNASPARAFVYYQAGQSQVMTCQSGVAQLSSDWQTAITDAAAHYGGLLLPESQSAQTQLLSYLPDSYNFLTNVSDSATDIMQQNMMANAIQDGVVHMGSETNSPAALEAYSFTKAQLQKRLTNSTIGDMAAYWLPIMKNVLEATLYGSFIFLFLLVLFPFGTVVLKNYLASLMWIQLWAPLYAILNLFMTIYAQHESSPLAMLNGQMPAITMFNQAGIAQVNADVASLAGYLSLSIPLIAAGLVKGLMSVFSQAAQYIAGVTQSVASSAAGEAVSGNISVGNTNFSNHSAYNTNANHFDANARVFSGMITTQLPGGSTVSVTPSGSTIMNNQPAISNLGTSVNLANAMREVAMQQADTAYSAGLNYANSYGTSLASGVKNLLDLSNQVSNSQASGSSSVFSVSGGTSAAINNVHQLTERFAKDQNISYGDATRFLATAYVSGHLGGGGNGGENLLSRITGLNVFNAARGDIGMKGDVDRSISRDERATFSAAQDFINNTNFSKSVDMAVRGIQEQSFRSSNEQAQRLADGVSSSFDQAEQSRQDMSSSFQQSQSYRQMASYADENSTTINSNANQAFMNWLEKQPSPNGSGPMGMRSAEYIMTAEPELAQSYAEQFARTETPQYLQEFQQSPASSPSDISSTYAENNQAIPGDTTVRDQDQINHMAVSNDAKKEGVSEKEAISHQAEKNASTLISAGQFGADSGKKSVDQKATNLINSVNNPNQKSD